MTGKNETVDTTTDNIEIEEEFCELNGFFKFENPGDTLIGNVIGFYANDKWRPGVQSDEIKGQYVLVTKYGIKRVNHTSQLSALDSLSGGTRVKVEFEGKVVTVRGKMHKFKISVGKSYFEQFRADIALYAQGGRPEHRLPQLCHNTEESGATETDPDADPFARE